MPCRRETFSFREAVRCVSVVYVTLGLLFVSNWQRTKQRKRTTATGVVICDDTERFLYTFRQLFLTATAVIPSTISGSTTLVLNLRHHWSRTPTILVRVPPSIRLLLLGLAFFLSLYPFTHTFLLSLLLTPFFVMTITIFPRFPRTIHLHYLRVFVSYYLPRLLSSSCSTRCGHTTALFSNRQRSNVVVAART